jgi:DNA-binding NarL/FixJ family response regulator
VKRKVLLAEDHDFTRQGIAFGLKKYENIEIVAETNNGKQAIALSKKLAPDIILMDIGMPVLSGIDAVKEIKAYNPDIKILMLTSHKSKEKVLASFNAKADAYCVKDIKIEQLANIIESVIQGAVWIDPAIAEFILEILQMKKNLPNIEKPDFNLTNREKEILKLIADGLSNKDISEKLVLSVYTVKNHVSNIIQKLSVDDRTQAAVIALKENLI